MMDAQYILAMGWTLIHSFWQLTLLAIVFYLIMLWIKNAAPVAKYWTGLLFMVLSVSVTCTTFIVMFQKYGAPLPSENLPVSVGPALIHAVPIQENANTGIWAGITEFLQANVKSLTIMYMIGLGILLLRMVFNFWKIQRLKSKSEVVGHKELKFLPRLVKKMDININFELRWSRMVHSPMVIGIVRPVVLIPASMVTNTTPSIMEAVLAHELAHIQRNDFLINIFQTLIETIFFYHPAVWYFSYVVRREREYSCDQKAIEAGCTKEDLARALTLVGQVQNQGDWAMTFGKRSNELLDRIRYLLGYRSSIRYAPSTSIIYYGSLLGIFILFSIGKSQFHPHQRAGDIGSEDAVKFHDADSLPKDKLRKIKVQAYDREKDTMVEVEVYSIEPVDSDGKEKRIEVVEVDTIPGKKKETVIVQTKEAITVIVNGDTVSVQSFQDMKKIQDSLRKVHIELRKNMPELKHLDSIMIEQRIKLDTQRMKFDVQRLYHDSLQSEMERVREIQIELSQNLPRIHRVDSILAARSIRIDTQMLKNIEMDIHKRIPHLDSIVQSHSKSFRNAYNYKLIIPDSVDQFYKMKFDPRISFPDSLARWNDTAYYYVKKFSKDLKNVDWNVDVGIDSIMQFHRNWDSTAFRSAFAHSFHKLENKSQEMKELEQEIRKKEQELIKLRQERNKKFMQEMKKEREVNEKK